MRKFVTILALLGLLLGAPALASAQGEAGGEMLSPEMAATLAKEKPLSQGDIDLYIKLLPQVPQATDEAAMTRFFQTTGLSEARFAYIFAKIPLAFDLASGRSERDIGLDRLPKVLHPTSGEVRLVKKNLEPLQAVMLEAATAIAREAEKRP